MLFREAKKRKQEQESSQQDEVEIYPSIAVAYDLAVKSYEFGERRLQAVESRNEKILGFTASLNLALIAFLSSSNSLNAASNSSLFILFILAFLSGIASLVVGLLVMLFGRVGTIDISKIYEGWLHLKEKDFKSEFIIKAEKDLKKLLKMWKPNHAALI